MTPEQKAINEWLESEEGKSCCNAKTLERDTRIEQILTNRLRRAFTKGMEAGKRIERERIKEKTLKAFFG